MPVDMMVAPAVGAMERVGGRHILPVSVMEAPTVGAIERAGGRHIMPVAVMEGPAVGMTERAHNTGCGDGGSRCLRDRRMLAGDGEGQFGPTDQHQRTLKKSRLYPVTVAATIGVKWTLQRRVLVVILNSPQ